MQKRTRIYLTMAHFGAIAAVGLLGAWALEWPDFVKGLMVGMLMIPLVVIPLRPMRDEYVESLWRSGTAWAFIAMVACFLLAPFAPAALGGLATARFDQEWPASATGYLAILAFFAGFHAKWLRR